VVYEKFIQLAPHLEEASFIRACKVAERTARILKGIQDDAARINPDLLSEEAEKGLFDLVNREEPVIVQMLEKSDYSGSAKVYGDKFYQPVHDFFDRVLVNHEDEKIRANRQALVRRVNRIYSERGADLSQLKATSA
ncbi:MAG: hypothetical protein HY588_04265, partial [Candidatus Omnitrophica bacterium]|nr:hypothetical protein [Candidatus Omnitrophota bacterium]